LVSVVLKNNNYTSKALHTLVFGEGIDNDYRQRFC
jgi:hypothetical protein